ncbi:S1C family serine protease [Jingyaoa shaoxingensis]|uniref:Trypsin-like peptidase domain-containing protein n=1 Tax=Jingyaoa shaoxingensis TaxID=2763671 RepID=A0ABR7N8H8_9FIRM|nr:trypsin-like peptidase domain-containing protein [Jingyaoa shaoxingensis]MBC8572694.1 trypsin-like peptidase domain-containing protein [Jingyaoa shaoxingensis]
MNKAKKLGIALAVITITGTAGTAIGVNTYNERMAGVQAEESTETESEADTSGITLGADASDSEATDTSSDGSYLPNVKEIAQNAMPSIVAITNQSKETIQFWGQEYEQDSESTGSGIIVGKSDTELLIATNNHVVQNADQLTVLFSADTENDEDKMVTAQVKGTDSSLDLAVVAVKLDDIPQDVMDQIKVIEIGDSDEVNVGDWSIAIGNALGYGQSVTFGIISALDREVILSTDNGEITQNMIQTDAAINFGNSGGALLDENGRLIGINSAKASSTGVEGMGYAIPINTAKSVIEDLMNQTTRTKADADKAGALGVRVTNVSEEARQMYNIPAGAYVYEVTDGSAAAEAGIKQGDIITKLDKTTISSMSELLDRIQYYEAGESVDVTIKRSGDNGYQEQVVTVTLQAKDTTDSSSQDEESTEEYQDGQSDDGDWMQSPDQSETQPGRKATGFGYFF